jgi:hypothetical protein
MSPAQAHSTLLSLGYLPSAECFVGGSTPYPGVVTNQNPASGTHATPGTPVTYVAYIMPTIADPHPTC